MPSSKPSFINATDKNSLSSSSRSNSNREALGRFPIHLMKVSKDFNSESFGLRLFPFAVVIDQLSRHQQDITRRFQISRMLHSFLRTVELRLHGEDGRLFQRAGCAVMMVDRQSFGLSIVLKRIDEVSGLFRHGCGAEMQPCCQTAWMIPVLR